LNEPKTTCFHVNGEQQFLQLSLHYIHPFRPHTFKHGLPKQTQTSVSPDSTEILPAVLLVDASSLMVILPEASLDIIQFSRMSIWKSKNRKFLQFATGFLNIYSRLFIISVYLQRFLLLLN